jgi:hypothetical protein
LEKTGSKHEDTFFLHGCRETIYGGVLLLARKKKEFQPMFQKRWTAAPLLLLLLQIAIQMARD